MNTEESSEQQQNKSTYYTGEAKFSPVPMSVSSPVIKLIDKNKVRANAVEAMHMQAQQQIGMLRKQAELIMQQVKDIEDRLKISELIYKAEMRFKPVKVGSNFWFSDTAHSRPQSLTGQGCVALTGSG